MPNNDLISRKALIEEAEKTKIRFPHDKSALFDLIEKAPAVDALILPCPLGTTLFRICEEYHHRNQFIRAVQFNRNNFFRIVFDGEFGKTVFLTREEAKAAIARMKG